MLQDNMFHPEVQMQPERGYGTFDTTVGGREQRHMRIGIVADSACDIPADFIERENITILPVTIQIGQAVLADTRNDEATMTFLSGETAARHSSGIHPVHRSQVARPVPDKLVTTRLRVLLTTTRTPAASSKTRCLPATPS